MSLLEATNVWFVNIRIFVKGLDVRQKSLPKNRACYEKTWVAPIFSFYLPIPPHINGNHCISGSKKEKYSHCPYPYQQCHCLTNAFNQTLLSIVLTNLIPIGDKFKLISQYLCRPFTHEHSLKKNFKIIHHSTNGVI